MTTERAIPANRVTPRPSFLVTKRKISVPLLEHRLGDTVYIVILNPMDYGKQINDEDEAPLMCRVFNVTEYDAKKPKAELREYDYILNAVTADTLNTSFENDGYVNRCFGVDKQKAPKGQRWHACEVIEYDVPPGLVNPHTGEEIS